MTKGSRLLGSAWLALLALAVISGVSWAGGDLFDADYSDCPVGTRLRDGQIADLTVARASDEADEVNVAWAVTNPATWGLGPNTYSARLVAILDDNHGIPVAETLSLGSRKVTFDKVKTGTAITVQLAIVVTAADGDYVVSDILETSVNQSLTEPSFGGRWHQLVEATPGSNDTTNDVDPNTAGHQYDTKQIAGGMMYYVGYNENFANYRKGTAVYTHRPATQRLRIGLAHSANETDGGRDDVDFDAYIIRIADADGDVVPEGDDMATMETNYGLERNSQGDTTEETLNKLFVHDMQFPNYPTFSSTGTIIRNADGSVLDYTTDFVFVAGTHWDTGITLTNMRVVDGFRINVAAHDLPENVLDREAPRNVNPALISIVKVSTTGDGESEYRDPGQLFANPPDEHRDFPVDTLQSDETYTITAWAVNADDEVISPVATLKLHLLNRMVTLSAATVFQDYLNTTAVNTGTLIVTQFTVLK
ncbi:MAG: hypothetical protein F4Y80_09090 [Caldilineaceae bacterium SB0665_bin_21]|nr:hypothetical protein [Caldilineaceae bacterium SB0665_bin_21]